MNDSTYKTALRLCLPSGRSLEEELISLTWTAGCSGASNGPLPGSTVAGTVKAKLTDTGLTLVNTFLTLQTNGAEGWEDIGRFRCETAEIGDGVVSITASDAMIWALERGYYPSEPAPDTALGVLTDLCAQRGLTLGETEHLTDVPVAGSLTGWTCREMAGYMAALLGCHALIGPGDRLELGGYETTDCELTADDYYSGGFTCRDEDWTLTGVSVTVPGEEQQTLTAGTVEPNVSFSNPYMTQALLDSLWERWAGFSYRPGTVQLPDGVDICPGDVIAVTGSTGERYAFAVMEVQHSYDGGIKTTLTAYGAAEGGGGSSYKGPATTAMERYAAEMATVKRLYAQSLTVSGDIVTDALSGVEINASKYLTGVTVVGDVIRAGTLTADKLVLIGPEGLIYEINAQSGGLTAEQLTEEQYQKAIDGSALVKHSVTADRIDVTDLFAQDITATGTIQGANLIGGTLSAEADNGSSLEVKNGCLSGLVRDDMNDRWVSFTLGLDAASGLRLVTEGVEYHSDAYKCSYYGIDSCRVDGEMEVWGAAYVAGFLTAAGDARVSGSVTVLNDVNSSGTVRGKNYIVENEANDGHIMIRDTGSVARQVMWISSNNRFNLGSDNTAIGTIIRGGGGITLNNATTVNGHVTATGSLVTGQNVVIPNDGSVYIRDVNNVARRMLTITSANAATVGHSALPLSVYGSGITLAGATTISGNLSNTGTISAGSAVYATTGIVAGNNYGFYVRNASGSQVKLFWLTSGNVCTVGSNDYATSILGKTITASKTITVSSDRRLKRDITVLDGRHQALFDRLRPVSYRLREDEDGKEHIGLVAQEVQEALEQSGLTNSALVQADSEGMLSIGYGELIGLLIDEVQTLKARVKALEERS